MKKIELMWIGKVLSVDSDYFSTIPQTGDEIYLDNSIKGIIPWDKSESNKDFITGSYKVLDRMIYPKEHPNVSILLNLECNE